MKNIKTKNKTVIVGILLIGLFFVSVILFTDYPKRLLRKLHPDEISWLSNENFKEQTDLYRMYQSQKNIVLLGTSQTYRVNWNELMGRNDIANRGIEGDITAGFLARMDFVFQLRPKICFIEGGINDLRFGATKEIAAKNLETIVDKLLEKNIIPVLTSISYVAKNFPNSTKFNNEIELLNTSIYSIATSKNIRLLDLNKALSENKFLNDEYAASDGIHLNSKAYHIWKNEILKILADLRI